MAPQVCRIEFNDEEIGMGFNSESALAVGTALERFTVQEDPAAPGMKVSASISIVNSHEQLMESMGMSFEAQGRYGLISASAKAQFSESSNYNSTSTFVVARCIARNPFRRGKGFCVTADAQKLLVPNRIDEFKKAFGNYFVRGLQTGGEFYAVIRITSVSEETQSDLSVELQAEANGLVASGSFKGKFQSANQKSSTRSEYLATMYQNAGSGRQISPTVEIDEVIARYKEFPSIAQSSAAAYETEIATYDTLPLPVPTPEEQEDFLFALADARDQKLRFIQTRNDLQFALQNSAFFEGLPEPQVLNDALLVYTKLINAVMDHAIRLSRGEMMPPRIFDPSKCIPPLFVPSAIALHRKKDAPPLPPPPTIRVPNFVDVCTDSNIEEIQFFLGHHYSIDDVVNDRPSTEQGQPANPRPRELVEFLNSGVQVKIDLLPGANEQGQNIVRAQIPQGGTLVAAGSQVVLQVG
jgi:hypothetical protein